MVQEHQGHDRPSPSQSSEGQAAASGAERPGKVLSPAAQRALAEAAERRALQEAREAELARVKELDGRGGLEPVRYNDWEIKGLTADF
jgi:hypothetical protein